MEIQAGDMIEVRSTQVGQAVRRGTVKQIVAEEPFELQVEWDDGHVSNLYPSGGMVRVIENAEG